MGYMYMPDKTAETIDNEGYLHSGDVAEFDNCNKKEVEGISGFMRITGRIKELIITAGGENIPPVLIEDEMKSAMPALSNCMVIGDRKKYLTMLISLKTDLNYDTGLPTDNLSPLCLHISNNIGSTAKTTQEAIEDIKWQNYITTGVNNANNKATSRAQMIQKWTILPQEFSEKGGELTPTLKIKRNIINDKYADIINKMYD